MRIHQMTLIVSFSIIACCLGLMVSQQQNEAMTVQLNSLVSVQQQANTNKYFQATVPNPNSDQILMITVSSDIQSYIGIFVSTSDSPNFVSGVWPDWSSYTQQCFYSSIDTCALRMPNASSLPNGQKNLTVYFTVSVGSEDSTYNLDVSLQTVYPIKVGKRYSVTFNKIEAAMLQLPASSFTTSSGSKGEQIIITCTYVSYKNIGHFQVIASADEIPNPSKSTSFKSKSLNGMTQILELDPLSSENSSYFILLQGENNTKFNFTVQLIESLTNPDLKINDTVSYLAKNSLNYSYHNLFSMTANSSVLPLYLELYAYRGYGKFTVDYCAGLYNFTFENTGGQSGEILIAPSMRNDCYQKVTKEGGLLIENLIVGVTDVYYEFGYSIGLFWGTFDAFLFPGIKQLGVIQNSQQQTYQVAAYGENVNLTLTAKALVGAIKISALSCIQTENKNNSKVTVNCTQISQLSLQQSQVPLGKLVFVCASKSFCQIRVSQQQTSTEYSKYSIELQYTNEQARQLQPNTPQYDMVEMNQYVHYFINVSSLRQNPQFQMGNTSVLNIRNTLVNGETVLLSSTTIKNPVFKDLFGKDSQVIYGWEGSITYIINQTYPQYIYIGVLGDSQSIYHIQYTLNTSANIPAAYLSMIDDAQNDFVITKNNPYILTKFVSHIIPYSITFDPAPSCIKYGSKLPLSNRCVPPSQMPNVFHEPVLYFNISQNLATPGAIFKFSAYANSGSYLLSEDRPILIGCQQQCYQLISVTLSKQSATILHSGDGHLIQLPAISGNEVSNGPLTLSCQSSRCTIQLNATMKYGGQMQVAFQSAFASQVEWRSKPMTLPNQQNPKHYYMRIPKYSEYTSFIFYAGAADLSIYYNVMSLNQSYTNTLDYSYPTETTFMGVSYGDPLQQLHIVDIDQQLLQQKKCKQKNVVCIVTMSVKLNSSVQYSEQYLNKGLGYYSANTYQYQLSPSQPVLKLKQQYSLSYFSHRIQFSTEQTSLPYTIHIQSLSNCRPQIQTESTGYIKNFYTDVRLPRVMPGQSRINYRVLSNQICLFNTAITTAPYELLFANIQYSVKIDKINTQFIAVYQHSQYSPSFTVSLKQPAVSIIVNKVAYSTDAQGKVSIMLPSMDDGYNVGYSQNSSTLTISDSSFNEYIIYINFSSAHFSKYALMPVLIRVENEPTILLHNQQHIYVFDPTDNSISAHNNPEFEYEYHSTNNFYIFASVNRLQLKLTVRNGDSWGEEGQIINTILTNTSQPWIIVNANPSSNIQQVLTNYRIKCEFIGTPEPGTKATFKIHIEEDGVAGLTQIYPGVSIYDAFVHDSAMNCYKFAAPIMLGEDKFSIDLNFIANQPTFWDIQNKLNMVLGIASISDKNASNLQIKQQRISNTTFRLTMNYVSGTVYKICFILNSLQLVGIQYSVVINIPSMPVVYNNEYIHKSKVYMGQYGMFEYINNLYNLYGSYELTGSPVTFTVTNCLSDPSTILASSSYSEMQTGKMTQISQQWSNDGVTAALVDVPHGYYYFGAKMLSQQKIGEVYRVNVQPATIVDDKPILTQPMFFINWNIKGKIYPVMKNGVEYVNIEVPGISRTKSANTKLNPIKIVYQLYIINLINSQGKLLKYPYSIDAYTKCPSLVNPHNLNSSNSSSNLFEPIQAVTINNPNMSDQEATVMFSLNVREFIEQSNISIKAEVYFVNDDGTTNVVEYFYGHDEILVEGGDQESSSIWRIFKWIFIICVIFSCIAGAAVFVKLYLKKRGRNVSFQMAEYPVDNTANTRRVVEPTVEVNNTVASNSASSNRRPLNDNAGYGEFVDES